MNEQLRHQVANDAAMYVPRELDKATLPEYRVEPPDILLIEAVNSIRRPDSPLEPGDNVLVRVQNGLPLDPQTDPEVDALQHQLELQLEYEFKSINSIYTIGTDGMLDMGPAYGRVPVAGLSATAAEASLKKYLLDVVGLKDPQVALTLQGLGGKQVIAGEHLVRPDGKVNLGIYGQVEISGLTLTEVKKELEWHLAEYINDPQVNVDVLAYNSKVYYVITDGGGYGEQVVRLPFTGNETVLDAISNIQGLSEVSSKKIWVARPAPANMNESQILDVHWSEIASEGMTATNYQIFPGDRVYIKADKMIATDNYLSKVFAPIERLLGVTLLGTGTAKSIRFFDTFGGGGN